MKEKLPALVFLMETKMLNNGISFIKQKIGYNDMFMVDCYWRSGGLILLWRDPNKVIIQNYNRKHINVVVKLRNNELEWRFIGINGHPETAKRRETWSLMHHLYSLSPKPWLYMGDFNEIVAKLEKHGTVG